MSFDGSENISVLPDSGTADLYGQAHVSDISRARGWMRYSALTRFAWCVGNGLSATRHLSGHAEKTLICSVRQTDKYTPARVAMSMDMQFS